MVPFVIALQLSITNSQPAYEVDPTAIPVSQKRKWSDVPQFPGSMAPLLYPPGTCCLREGDRVMDMESDLIAPAQPRQK